MVWNPVTGCSAVSDGCKNCYAATMTGRLAGMKHSKAKYAGLLNSSGHFNGTVRCHEDVLDKPLNRRKPTTYFVNSMSDLFHAGVPFEFIDKVFAVMMALCPQHTFQILTKRPERMAEYLYWHGQFTEDGGPLPNVWLGTSVENQQAADERIPHLLKCPAAVRFLSIEPLLGAIDFLYGPQAWGLLTDIDWAIIGGESGSGARPCNVAWIRSLIDQCKAAGVPAFVKQLGKVPYWAEHRGVAKTIHELRLKHPKGGDMSEWPEDLRVREMPESSS